MSRSLTSPSFFYPIHRLNHMLPPSLPTHAGSPPTSVVPPVDLLGISSMPKPSSKLTLDFSSLLGPLFYTWVVQLLVSLGPHFVTKGVGETV